MSCQLMSRLRSTAEKEKHEDEQKEEQKDQELLTSTVWQTFQVRNSKDPAIDHHLVVLRMCILFWKICRMWMTMS